MKLKWKQNKKSKKKSIDLQRKEKWQNKKLFSNGTSKKNKKNWRKKHLIDPENYKIPIEVQKKPIFKTNWSISKTN
jgi:hypothetical protein